MNKRIKNIYIDVELVLPMYKMHPYFPLKFGQKSAYYTQQNMVYSSIYQ